MTNGCRLYLPDAHQPLAETGDQFAIGWRQAEEEAIDCLDDHSPLREPSHGAEGVQTCLEFRGHADTELRIVLDLLSLSGAGGGPPGAATGYAVVGHSS